MPFAMKMDLTHGLRNHVWTGEMATGILLKVEELGSGGLDDSVGQNSNILDPGGDTRYRA